MKKNFTFITLVLTLLLTGCSMDSLKGEQGDKGETGVGILKIELTSSDENIDIYTIYYTDGITSTFKVTNGVDGENGEQGIQGIQGEKGEDGYTPVITIENGNWYIDGKDTGIVAEGVKGDTGNGISKIELTSSNGLVDTYTITFTNGDVATFKVTNGVDGENGEQGIQGIQGEKGEDGHTPVITIENGNWYIDGKDTGIAAEGVKGDTGNGISNIELTSSNGLVDTYTITFTNGDVATFDVTNGENGESAYEIYLKYYPDYTGSEEQWIYDLVNGNLKEKTYHTVNFDSDGGSNVNSQQVISGGKINKPEDPIKEGYKFLGWYLEGEIWSFIGYSVTEDITLKAKWEEIYTEGITFYPQPNDTYGVAAGTTYYLENIIIPSTYNGKEVTMILDNSFVNAVNLKNITLPNTITYIGSNAFDGCKQLSLTIPESVNYIGENALKDVLDAEFINDEPWISKYESRFTYEYKYYRSNSDRPDSISTKYLYNEYSLGYILSHSIRVQISSYSAMLVEGGCRDEYVTKTLYTYSYSLL